MVKELLAARRVLLICPSSANRFLIAKDASSKTEDLFPFPFLENNFSRLFISPIIFLEAPVSSARTSKDFPSLSLIVTTRGELPTTQKWGKKHPWDDEPALYDSIQYVHIHIQFNNYKSNLSKRNKTNDSGPCNFNVIWIGKSPLWNVSVINSRFFFATWRANDHWHSHMCLWRIFRVLCSNILNSRNNVYRIELMSTKSSSLHR